MLIELASGFFVFISLFLGFLILVQPGKSGMGIGGASKQLLFGGSGGQSFLEKFSWVLVALFIGGSLGLAIAKSYASQQTILSAYRAVKPVATP